MTNYFAKNKIKEQIINDNESNKKNIFGTRGTKIKYIL